MTLDGPWMLLFVGFGAAFVTRAVGVVISGQVEPDTRIFDWFTCVGQALVGGLMIRAIFLPSTPLADTLVLDRAIALGAAFAVFFLAGRRLLPSTLMGVAVLAALNFARIL